MNNVAFFDLGTRTGVALANLDTNTIRLAEVRCQPGFVYRDFPAGVAPILDDVQHVFYEAVHAHMGVEAAHVYGFMKYWLLAVTSGAAKPIGVGAIKKSFAGNGHASKVDMAVAFFREFPSSIMGQYFHFEDEDGFLVSGLVTENTIDAYAGLKLALAQIAGGPNA